MSSSFLKHRIQARFSVVLALFLLLDVSSIIILYVLLAAALTQVLPIEIVTDVTNTGNGEPGTGVWECCVSLHEVLAYNKYVAYMK